jgi:hypothetical protein
MTGTMSWYLLFFSLLTAVSSGYSQTGDVQQIAGMFSDGLMSWLPGRSCFDLLPSQLESAHG